MLGRSLVSLFSCSYILFGAAFGENCVLRARGDAGDDTPALLDAFKRCGQDGTISLPDPVYQINQVMNTTNLKNCQIDLRGKLLWSKDVNYWLDHSMPIFYQNQSTVWFLGGDNITFNGFGIGTIDGNGQTWYDFAKGRSNYPRRPMGLTIAEATNSRFLGLRFVQSQMWTMTILRSSNILLEDIYVNSSASNGARISNTDGADTLYADNITFRRWTIANGDDGISIKANSTNILIEDSTFHGGAVAFGSIGQYDGRFETIENVTMRNITYLGRFYAAYVKTWTGKAKGIPPNGGGGGLGFINNITISDIKLTRAAGVFFVTQCTHWSSGGEPGDCDTSKFKVHNITVTDVHGVVTQPNVATLKCSPAAPCSGIKFDNIDVSVNGTSNKADQYICTAVVNPIGWNCTQNRPVDQS